MDSSAHESSLLKQNYRVIAMGRQISPGGWHYMFFMPRLVNRVRLPQMIGLTVVVESANRRGLLAPGTTTHRIGQN